ncbi:hypothetical protein [Granulicoccus phenolivorans]|uniref:hypothetical protein n=1 Tax=Granulicoccus phenolivorans TaxID=266854 RepID=UPI00047BAE29|nr:hypothetical protein [Granulicoccus phenolivorans]
MAVAAGALVVMSPEPTCSNQILQPGQICQVTRKGTPQKLDYDQMAAEHTMRRWGAAGVGAAIGLAGGGLLITRAIRRPAARTAVGTPAPDATLPPPTGSLRGARNAVALDVTRTPPPPRPSTQRTRPAPPPRPTPPVGPPPIPGSVFTRPQFSLPAPTRPPAPHHAGDPQDHTVVRPSHAQPYPGSPPPPGYPQHQATPPRH